MVFVSKVSMCLFLNFQFLLYLITLSLWEEIQLIKYRWNSKFENGNIETFDTKTILHVVQVGGMLSRDGVISSPYFHP